MIVLLLEYVLLSSRLILLVCKLKNTSSTYSHLTKVNYKAHHILGK